ncbi:MAG: hypothetical protein IPO63_12320 [Bacteroidetes bacterium]|nr:hypothetical protein [Bacteroidota bacterium]
MTQHTNDMERERELKDAPTLRNLPTSNFFNAPDGYFDSLSSKIQDRIQENKSKTYIIPIFRPAFVGISFTLMIICISLLYFNSINKKVDYQAQQETPSLEEIIDSGYYLHFEEAVLAETLCDLPNKGDSIQLSTQEAELENYLIQSMNETTLLNEL